jgi:PAS domain-containing protein
MISKKTKKSSKNNLTAEKRTNIVDDGVDFQDLVTNIPGAVYRCKYDSDWTMEYISPTIKEISGYSEQDFLHNKKKTYASIIHPDDLEKNICQHYPSR